MAFTFRGTMTAASRHSRASVFAYHNISYIAATVRTPFLDVPTFFCKRHLCNASIPTLPSPTPIFTNTSRYLSLSLKAIGPRLHFSSEPDASNKKKIDTKVNFSLSDSESESDEDTGISKKQTEIGRAKKLPPPYDPFNKKSVIEEPDDPKNLQEIFHSMRSGDGLFNNAVKMFDALSKDGLTHEALELFSQIKDKGQMPDVVAHTAVIEAYANAGQPKEALKVYLRMLASGVSPNAYTYTVLIKGLAADPKFLKEAKKYLIEMMDKGIRPNGGTYTAVFEALVKEQKEDEAKELLEHLKTKGFMPDEKAAREALNNKRGPVFRTVISILFGK